ncbi:protein phosphatase 2C domain-containing protein [Leifsonia bigeumensis]|uniref:Protein phosphatase 2C domain-containing protein n=1 Tax=Leifsonella bigeumensis TaxID=433643 RepID=A0ABP7FW29_9MICO
MTVLGDNTERREIALPGGVGSSVTLAWGIATDVGLRRAHNEDSLVADAPIFAVADGMGGHAAGDVASDAVVTRLAELAQEGFTQAESIVEALRAATTDISHAIDERELGVGTTVTGAALVVNAGHPYWVVFNVGDSRLYLFDHNVLTQITVDHSVVQELVTAGLISSTDAEHHPDSNVVTRAVGFNTEPVPDFWLLPVARGSRLLLCSDGLTREVSELRLRLHLAAGLNPRETALALVDAALAAGGRDNVTAIVIDVLEVSGAGGEEIDVEDTAPGV